MVDIYDQFKDFKAFEVSFTNKEQQTQTLYCSVKSIENNRIILDANNQRNNNVFTDVGDELRLHIYTDNGIYSATSKVLLVTKGLMNTEYIIAYPANSKHSQRREYFRADLAVNFLIDIMTAEEPPKKISFEAKTRNVCGKGMSFVHDKPFPEYSSIRVNMLFKERTLETTATLVYSKQIVAGSNPKYIHAFVFNSISQKNIDYIVKQCFLYQLDLKKKMHQQ